jgi:hypothetical protein
MTSHDTTASILANLSLVHRAIDLIFAHETVNPEAFQGILREDVLSFIPQAIWREGRGICGRAHRAPGPAAKPQLPKTWALYGMWLRDQDFPKKRRLWRYRDVLDEQRNWTSAANATGAEQEANRAALEAIRTLRTHENPEIETVAIIQMTQAAALTVYRARNRYLKGNHHLTEKGRQLLAF